jgi:hypothetical protein
MMRIEAKITDKLLRPALLRRYVDIFLLISFTYISLRVIYDYRMGGNPWKQGDWLINNAAGLIRRGPFGSAIIFISDLIDINPLLLVSVVQIALLAALFISFRLLVKAINNPKISLILIVSPAVFSVFWCADPQGSVRKELIAFLGLTTYARGAFRANWKLLWLGVGLFCVSAISHEAMSIFVPNFLWIIISSELYKTSFIHSAITLAAIFCFSIISFVFALMNSRVEDTTQICMALTARGLNGSICDGAIRWLSYDSSFGLEQVVSRLGAQSVVGFLISYAAALAPFAYVIWLSERKKLGFIALILLALPFAPLYIVAVDWGRWISFHIFSAAVILACAMAKNKFPLRSNPSNNGVMLLTILGLFISPQHTMGIMLGGIVRQVASDVWTRLS